MSAVSLPRRLKKIVIASRLHHCRKVRFEVFADRLGSPIDTVLVVRNEAGVELARAEDSPGSLDPILEYTVPDKVKAIQVGVVDSQGKGGSRGLYRLTIDTISPAVTRSDCELITPTRRISLPTAGSTLVPVWFGSRGYTGAIELATTSIPAGLKIEGLTIPPGAEGTLVSLKGSGAAIAPSVTRWQGKDKDGREHSVMQKDHSMARLQPWLATEIALAGIAGKGQEFQVEWKAPKANDVIVFGRRWPLAVKCTRTGVTGPVRLSLLTSQLPPLVNNQPDLNKTIRLEKPIEIAPMASESEVALLIPVELPGEMYDLAIQAELLSADKKTVISTAYTSVRRLPTRLPMALKVSTPARMDVTLDATKGALLEIAGKVERFEGSMGEVLITLTGLPPGVAASPLTVKAGDSNFQFKLSCPQP